MKNAEERLAEARLEERIARARWFDTLDELQERATPGGIVDEVWESVQEGLSRTAGKAVNAAKERPFVTAGVGLAVGVFAFRRSIFSAIARKIRARRATDEPVGR